MLETIVLFASCVAVRVATEPRPSVRGVRQPVGIPPANHDMRRVGAFRATVDNRRVTNIEVLFTNER